MRKIFLALFFSLTLTVVCSAQVSNSPASHIRYGSSLPATCKTTTGDVFFLTTGSIGLYQCVALNTWGQLPGGANITWDGTTMGVNGALNVNPQTVGSELAGNWTNSVTLPFGTLTSSGATISSAITGGGNAFAYQSIALTSGNTYRITFTITVTAGRPPYIVSAINDATSSDQLGFFAAGQILQPGTNSITFVSSRTATDFLGFKHASGDPSATFSVSGFSVKQIVATTGSLTAANSITALGTITGGTVTTASGTFTNPVGRTQSEFFGADTFIDNDATNSKFSTSLGQGITVRMSGAVAIGQGVIAQNNSYTDFTGASYGGFDTLVGLNAGNNGHGNGTCYGSFTECNTSEAVAVGPSSKALFNATVAIGDKAEAKGGNTTSHGAEFVICDACTSDGYLNIAIGDGGHYTHESVIGFQWTSGINSNGADFADQQMLIGGVDLLNSSKSGIKDIWVGDGDVVTNSAWTNTSAISSFIHATGGQGSNNSGGNIGLVAGVSTGLNAPGYITMQGGAQGTTGSTAQTVIDRYIVGTEKILTNSSPIAIINATDASNTTASFNIAYGIQVFDGTNLQNETGEVTCSVINKGGVFSANTCTKFGNVQALGSGTLTVTFAISAANPAVISVNAASSLTPSTGFPKIVYKIANLTDQAIVVQ